VSAVLVSAALLEFVSHFSGIRGASWLSGQVFATAATAAGIKAGFQSLDLGNDLNAICFRCVCCLRRCLLQSQHAVLIDLFVA
jgi:hypothetical protein